MPDKRDPRSPGKMEDDLIKELEELRKRLSNQDDAKKRQEEFEEALKESQRFLTTLISNIPGMVYRCRNDENWTMEFVSEGCYDITGYRVYDLLMNRTIAYNEIIHPEDRQKVHDEIQAAIKKDIPFRITYRIKTKDGKEKWVWEQGRKVERPDGGMETLEGFITDITDRMLAEESLKLAWFSLDKAVDIIIWADVNGKLIYVNDTACKMLGYTKEELLSMSVWDIDTASPKDKWPDSQSYMEKYGFVKFETNFIKKDRSLIPVELISYMINFKGEGIHCAIIRDITEAKSVEESLKLASAYNRSLIEASLDPLVTISPEGKITDVNTATENVVGHSREQLIGTDFASYFTDPERAKEGYLRVLKEGSVKDYMLEIKHHDGHITPVLYNASLYRDEKGNVRGVFAAARDMTERLKAEKALKESEERYRSIGELIPYGVWICDSQGNMQYMSKSFLDLIGMTLEEGKKYGWTKILPPKDRERTQIDWKKCVERECFWDYEHRVIGKDGKLHIILSRGLPIRDEHGNITSWAGINLDITERKKIENELNEAKNQAELYIDLMGHDLNNMNHIAMGYLEIAIDKLKFEGRLTDDDLSLLEKPVDVLKSNSHLIDNVKKLQRERTGEIKPEVIDIGRTMEKAIKYFADIPGRVIRIINTVPNDTFVLANELIFDVFTNLIGNAIKHSKGEICINIGMDTAAEEGKNYYRIWVEDNGPGIPDDLKMKIFERLSLVNIRAMGKGFGLCLVKTLIDDYHGKFWVEDSVPGDYTKGAKFIVMLPAYK